MIDRGGGLCMTGRSGGLSIDPSPELSVKQNNKFMALFRLQIKMELVKSNFVQ